MNLSPFRAGLAATLLSLAPVTPLLAADAVPAPEHDDHGVTEPPAQGVAAAACEQGVAEGYACRNVELLARVPLTVPNIGGGNDIWGWEDSETGDQYALMGHAAGTSVIRVSDPEQPEFLGVIPSTTGSSGWRDIKTYANHAYIVADGIPGHGLQVFDLTRLRGASGQSPATFSPDTTYTDFGPAHNVAINEDSGFAYVVGSDTCAGGLHMVSLANPAAPVNAGCYQDDGYTHDVQCVDYAGPDARFQEREICFAANEDTLTIVDVSNKSNPQLLGRLDYPMVGYTHQGWLTDDHRYFLAGDELDELGGGVNARTLVFDVSVLDVPAYAGAHHGSHSTIDHNLYVRGAFVYQANYSAGLRILRIRDAGRADFEEIAYFDTFPGIDRRQFEGAWSVYPFFDDGTLLVSDMNSGLFVLRAALPEAAGMPINGRLSGLWVAEGLNDQGLTLFVGENAFAGEFVYFAWFIYLDGEPFWVAGDVPYSYGDDEVVIPAQRLRGLDFLQPGENLLAEREDIGTLTIHPHGCNHLHVHYDFDGLGEGELDMHRLVSVEGRECPDPE
ncbi:MAG: choice-of-anchor B family protein [Xanthomonadales bacterium]|nr:choice-of-anchor B family protein [Xanthomonadales bacterium]